MNVNMTAILAPVAQKANIDPDGLQLPAVVLDPATIRVIMINEVPPADPAEGFYGTATPPADLASACALFQEAGVDVTSVTDLLDRGIYLTTAVKSPKSHYTVPRSTIVAHLPLLEAELDTFPNLQVVMLMGDVARKAFNQIARKRTGKAAIPNESTYRIRDGEFYAGDWRVFPSYIMTGGNILIEKSKRRMVADDITRMLSVINRTSGP